MTLESALKKGWFKFSKHNKTVYFEGRVIKLEICKHTKTKSSSTLQTYVYVVDCDFATVQHFKLDLYRILPAACAFGRCLGLNAWARCSLRHSCLTIEGCSNRNTLLFEGEAIAEMVEVGTACSQTRVLTPPSFVYSRYLQNVKVCKRFQQCPMKLS